MPIPEVDEGRLDFDGPGIWLAPCVLQPKARGSVRLAGADPTKKPVIRCNYWHDEDDLITMRNGIRLTMQLARQGELSAFCSAPLQVPASEDDSTLDEFIARHTMTFYHASGTAAMGSVVDSQLRVLGVDGLRVVDASVFPQVPRGNPNAAVIAVAEHASRVVLGELKIPLDS